MQLTFAEKSSENPQWSPDGRMLAFTSSRSGKNNLYMLRWVGGEAEQKLTSKNRRKFCVGRRKTVCVHHARRPEQR